MAPSWCQSVHFHPLFAYKALRIRSLSIIYSYSLEHALTLPQTRPLHKHHRSSHTTGSASALAQRTPDSLSSPPPHTKPGRHRNIRELNRESGRTRGNFRGSGEELTHNLTKHVHSQRSSPSREESGHKRRCIDSEEKESRRERTRRRDGKRDEGGKKRGKGRREKRDGSRGRYR